MLTRRQWIAGTAGAAGAAGLGLLPGVSAASKPGLITRLQAPYCGEPRLEDLGRGWITPTEHFFVLNHGEVPRLEAGGYRLQIRGLVREPLTLSLRQLREEFPRVEVEATLMCAGNRRARMDAMRRIAAVPQWSAGAIGNARWAGVPLRAVLERVGLRARARHVHLRGCDRVDRGDVITRFAGSIPMGLVRQRDPAPVILAYEMNGAPLTRAHGFPLRAVVPGAIGARSVKWLDTIAVEPAPSDNPHFIKGHRLPRAGVSKPIFSFPPTGGIFADAALASDADAVCGYAFVGGRDRITRVEISVDGGQRWQPARLVGPDRPGCWRLWRADVDLRGASTICARATTRFGRRMPRQARWNAHGYLYDAWPRVAVARDPS